MHGEILNISGVIFKEKLPSKTSATFLRGNKLVLAMYNF